MSSDMRSVPDPTVQ